MACFVSRSDRTVTAAGRQFRASALRHLNATCPVLEQTRGNVNRVTNSAALRERTEQCPEPGCWRVYEVLSVDVLMARLQQARDELGRSEKAHEELRSRSSRRRLWADKESKRAVGDVAAAHQRVSELVDALAKAKRHEKQRRSAQDRKEARVKASAELQKTTLEAKKLREDRQRENARKALGAGPYDLVLAGVGRTTDSSEMSEAAMALELSLRVGLAPAQAKQILRRAIHVEPQALVEGISEAGAIRVKLRLEKAFAARVRIIRTGGAGSGFVRKPIPSRVRTEVWNRDGGQCVDCGSRERLEYDHIIPVSRGGANTVRNLELRCETCNRRKGATI